MVAWLLEVRRRFSVVFLTLKSRNFVKICFYFFCHKLNLISGENSPLKEMLSLHRNHLFYSICNCQHSIERKILLSKVHRTTFLNTLKSSLPSKKWTLGFCRILKGSYSKKDWQNTELSHFLLERLKHHKDHWILKTIFACKSFICVRQKHITPKRITLS